jgi:hypothetical protein
MKPFAKRCSTTAIAGLLSVLGPIANAQVAAGQPPSIVPIFPYDAKVHHSSECQPAAPIYANLVTYSQRGLERRRTGHLSYFARQH